MKYKYLLICLIISSCASLNLNVDLYKGELKDQSVGEIISKIESIKNEIRDYEKNKIYISDRLIPLYLNWVKLNPGNLETLPEQAEHYNQLLNHSKPIFTEHVDNIINELNKVKSQVCLEILPIANGNKAKGKPQAFDCDYYKIADQIIIIVEKLDNPVSEFDTFFYTNWNARLVEAIAFGGSHNNSRPDSSEQFEAIQAMTILLDEIKMNVPRLGFVYDKLVSATNVDSVIRSNPLMSLTSSSLSNKEVLDYTSNILYNAKLLNRSEAGSFAWKQIIYNGANKKAWERVYGKTHWRATGNSEVVIVKDSPVDFRVKQGRNDPKNIIGAQMIIGRSISDLGLALAGIDPGGTTSDLMKEDDYNIEIISKRLASEKANQEIDKIKKEMLTILIKANKNMTDEEFIALRSEMISMIEMNIINLQNIKHLYD